MTKKILPGVPSLLPYELNKLPKSKRRPNRPYGGVLSSEAMREKIISSFDVVNSPLEIGQLVIKTAGRDAGKIGVIVDIEKNTVILDGQTRRKKCNIAHIVTLDKKIKIKPNASHDVIKKELKLLNIEIKEKQEKKKQEKTDVKEAAVKTTKTKKTKDKK